MTTITTRKERQMDNMTTKTPAQLALEQAQRAAEYSRRNELIEADKERTAQMEFAVGQHEAKVKAEEKK